MSSFRFNPDPRPYVHYTVLDHGIGSTAGKKMYHIFFRSPFDGRARFGRNVLTTHSGEKTDTHGGDEMAKLCPLLA